ncbi:hypothetical protein [Corallococcus caeni]|uniref:DUF4232 domain-containing protein n=1 Tax=Corallococcus caeni TaxID=3082388 RepID=A0ABQ6R4N3_9BACT|nr:hypothetical protein ASNO1_75220 [Corallococcus sp. NO1]
MGSDPLKVLGGVVLGLAAVWGAGCKKDAPAASAPVDAGVVVATVDAGIPDAGTVARISKPLRFSNVGLKRVADGGVTVSYTLTNPGTAQGRGNTCLMLVDEHGLAISSQTIGFVTVKGGGDDTFEDSTSVDDLRWNQARSLILYTTAYDTLCYDDRARRTSEPFPLLPTGAPAPAGLPVPKLPPDSTPEDFEVSGLQLRRGGTPPGPSLTYTVKNVSGHRASASGCLRAYAREGSYALEEVDVGEFDLAPAASSTQTVPVAFHKDRHWGEATVLRFFVDPYGCVMSGGAGNPGLPVNLPAEAGSEEAHHDAE